MRQECIMLYEYYRVGGMRSWLIDKITKQLTVLSVGSFFLFFLSFYNFTTGIIGWNSSWLGVVMLLLFGLQVLYDSYGEVVKYNYYCKAQETLMAMGFNDEDLSHIRWKDIAYKLVEMNIVENEIMIQCSVTCEDNFLIDMIDKGHVVGDMFLGESYIMFIKLCIRDYMNKDGRSKSFGKICYTYAIVSLIAIPYLIIYSITLSLIKYAIAIYSSPSNLLEMKWNKLGYYTFRHFNELPHEFEARMRSAGQVMTKYNSLFPSPNLSKIAERLAFIVSECAIGLIIILYFTSSLTADTSVTPIKVLTTLIVIWGVLDKIVEKKSNKPNHSDVEHDLNDVLQHHSVKYEVCIEDKEKLGRYYKFNIVIALTELVSIIVTPLLLFYTSAYRDITISEFIDSNTCINDTIGILFKGTEFNHNVMESMTASKLLHSYHQYEKEYSDLEPIRYSKMLNSRFLDSNV